MPDHHASECEKFADLKPLQDPLTRTWVLYELLVSIVDLGYDKLEILMSKREERAFLKILMNGMCPLPFNI